MPANHRDNPSFTPKYKHLDFKTGGTLEAPFPVAVFGKDQPPSFLGIGQVIGAVTVGGAISPVIEVQDIAEGQGYTLLGSEAAWQFPVPEIVEARLARKELAIDSVRAYLDRLRAEKQGFSETVWLEGLDIDPRSIM